MKDFASSGPQAIKPAANVYTALLWVAILAMAIGAAVVLNNLMSVSGYGLSFGELFSGIKQQ